MKSIVKQIKICRNEFLCDVCICLGGAAFGVAICLISDFVLKNDEMIWGRGIITMFSFFGGMFVLLFTGIMSVMLSFNLTVGMSSTRKEYLAGRVTVIILRFATVYVVNGIIYLLERNKNVSYYLDMSVVFSPVMIAVAAGGTSVILFIGACIMKFGNKILWVFWTFWMGLCLLPSRVASDYRNHTGSVFDRTGQAVIKIYESITPAIAFTVGMVFVGILFIVSIKLLLKQKVQY